MSEIKVTTMGGGTGTFAVITALKELKNVNISSIVAVSDSGGSTGRIRDEFGFQPVGDLRQSLAALADPAEQEWVQKLLLYRFEKGNSFKGHNLGNLIMTALQDMTESTTQALDVAARLFDLHGKIIPVTEENVELKITFQDGSEVIGEHTLDESPDSVELKKIKSVSLIPECVINPVASKAILESDLIIIGPGDYYASLMAVLAVPGIKTTMKKFEGKLMYVVNLMTRVTQTHGMTAKDHVEGIEEIIGKKFDLILLNSGEIPADVISHYAKEREHPVKDDLKGTNGRIIRSDLISTTPVKKSESDDSYRSVLRHDSDKLMGVLKKILNEIDK